MKKLLSVVLALAFAAALPSLSHAKASLPQNSDSTGFLQPTPFQSPAFIGIKATNVLEGALASQGANGPGTVLLLSGTNLIYAVCVSGGSSFGVPTGTDYVTLFDTNTGANVDVNSRTGIISPAIWTARESFGYAGLEFVRGCWYPTQAGWPVRVENGLAVAVGATNMYTTVYYRSDAGTNPF